MSSDPTMAPRVEVMGITKRFGALTAVDDVSLCLPPGSFHAVLGENGAGKSTLVKCIMGYHPPDAGCVRVDGQAVAIPDPRRAHALGFGMVYQHFTLVPSMTVAENLLIGKADLPPVLRWGEARARIEAFLAAMPFRLALDRPAASLAAGEKQKLEILKQLFLGSRVLILDEPTSVLTPDEADQILTVVQDMTAARRLSVILITHKLREVLAFAREVTVLRGGRRVGGGAVADVGRHEMVRLMMGEGILAPPAARAATRPSGAVLELRALFARDDRGAEAVRAATLAVAGGEVVGIAGVSGNGQRELVQVLAGQRQPESGAVLIHGTLYGATRAEKLRHRVAVLIEEPLRNASVRGMSVEENLAVRTFDQPEATTGRWLLDRRAMRQQAAELIRRYRIHTPGVESPLDTLSGGNVQRVLLARELSGAVGVLVAQNPCAGLDLGATAEIRTRILEARNAGAAVLLVSEDLDEILELADRIVVMYEGRFVHETTREAAAVQTIGRAMAGHA
jgi:simple sugar transport system ATP-binding protein